MVSALGVPAAAGRWYARGALVCYEAHARRAYAPARRGRHERWFRAWWSGRRTSASSASTLPNRTLGHSPARRPASSVVCEHMGAQLAQKCRTTGSVPPPLSACSSAAVATACKQRDRTHPLACVSRRGACIPEKRPRAEKRRSVAPQRRLQSEILPRPRPVPPPCMRRCCCRVRARVPRHRVRRLSLHRDAGGVPHLRHQKLLKQTTWFVLLKKTNKKVMFFFRGKLQGFFRGKLQEGHAFGGQKEAQRRGRRGGPARPRRGGGALFARR